MGKCKFNNLWMDKISFRHWLKPVVGNVHEAYCTLCKKRIQLATMGVKALDSHAKSAKHENLLKLKDRTPSVSSVFPVTVASQLAAAPAAQAHVSQLTPPAAASASTAAPPPIVDLRTAFGSTPTLKAEVLWTLHCISKHQS